jgi:hypothetical protein
MVVVPMLLGTTPDEEEFRFAILASVLHVRALEQGSWQWWNADPSYPLRLPLGSTSVTR